MLEAADHDYSSFVTLTYADQNLPDNGSLRPCDVQLWLKRLRKRIAPDKVRFFAVGEYGDHNWRPHYHVALFGFEPCGHLIRRFDCLCPSCTVVRETWGFGHVTVDRLEEGSARYIVGYVVKKMTAADDGRLCGRHPEFARMSLRPGIGADAMWHVASEMMRYDASVPVSLGRGRKQWPLGRYLRNKLREMTGREEGATPEELAKLAEHVQAVRSYAWANDRSVSSVFYELNEGLEAKLAQKEARWL